MRRRAGVDCGHAGTDEDSSYRKPTLSDARERERCRISTQAGALTNGRML